MLGNPDAYHLPSTPGAGWFKVDATVYERFEAALVGAVLPFRPLAPVEGPLAGEGVQGAQRGQDGHAVPAGRRTGAGGGPAGQRSRLGGPEGLRSAVDRGSGVLRWEEPQVTGSGPGGNRISP